MNKSLYRLMVGFRQFKRRYFAQAQDADSLYQKLASSGQTPKTLLIGCSDSRVDPAIMTEALPGELFVVRNVANLVPPCEPASVGFHGTSSAIEFAIQGLQVENIIVLGHRQCGGIKALLASDDSKPETFITQWMKIAEEARLKVLDSSEDEETKGRLAEMESLKISVRNLHTFPFVQQAVQKRNLTVLGVYFDLEQGKLFYLDQKQKEFKLLRI